MIVRWRWYQPTGIKACSGSPRAPDVLPGVLAGDAWCRPEAIGVTASPGHSPTSAPFVLLGTPWTSSRSRAREGDQASIHPVGTSCGSGPALPSWFTATELRRREVNRRIAVSVSVTEEYLRWPLRGALTATSQHRACAARSRRWPAVRKPMTDLVPARAWPWLPPGSARSAMTWWPATWAAAGSPPLTQRPGASLAQLRYPTGHPAHHQRPVGLASGNGGLADDTTTGQQRVLPAVLS
jgi:hypothetical protein